MEADGQPENGGDPVHDDAEEEIDADEISDDASAADDDLLVDDELASAVQPVDTDLVDLPLSTSHQELSFREALAVTARRGARLVVPMGEAGVGKTTIMAEIWTYLIGHGPLDGIQCAGSRTPIAFEERAFLSRMAAKQKKAATERTVYNENEGLLHVRVARPDHKLMDLLFADYSGERYRLIRDGAAAEGEIPFVARADRIMLVVNGGALGDPSARELETNHSKRLLVKVRDAGLVSAEARVAVVVARADQVDEGAWAAAQARLEGLLGVARQLDADAPMLKLSARPADGWEAWGLGELMTWICADQAVVAYGLTEAPPAHRSMERFS